MAGRVLFRTITRDECSARNPGCEYGVETFFIYGSNPGANRAQNGYACAKSWILGIERPFSGEHQKIVKRTDTSDPDFFHKVVDCQWGCPAHTDVPEYIRLIAQGRFDDAYMVNRESNVFPGILGRVCDRPCEPACRRGRMDEKPVAICRLKRVAADHKSDITDRLPVVSEQKNGKKIALVGAGCASLTVCNDLMPLGYDCTIFEAQSVPGGLTRYNIPAFRLPVSVLEEEINYVLDMGVNIHYNHRVDSMSALLDEGYDAVFIGTGAPRGKELKLPGRYDSENIFIGIDWLESVAFSHIDSIGENVLIIGVGNTAMDCCRTSLRLGAKNVKVMARKPRDFFKASDWELEDAEEERVEIVVNHSPKEFVIEKGKLKGMVFELMDYTIENGRITETRIKGETFIPCDDVVLAIGQENAFPWIERDLGIEFNQWEEPKVDPKTFESSRPGVFFGGDSAFGPKNIIWAVEHGHQAAISIHLHCQGRDLGERLPDLLNLGSRKMGMHEWSYSNNFDPAARRQMMHVPLAERFEDLSREVELGFDANQAAEEVERCLNCDIQTVFFDSLCIECDACLDICPTQCLTITANGEEEDLVQRLKAPRQEPEQPLFVSDGLKQTGRVMVKDENFCVHCGLCAERCPTAAWDMQKSLLSFPTAADHFDSSKSGTGSCQQRKAG
jgi:NADPH-dependent glutamate synthase beta subunit-like oxidoreductase